MMTAIDDLGKTAFHRSLFNLWLMLRLNAVGATFTTAVAATIVARPEIDASLAGFALTFALQFTVAIEWTIRQFSATQLAMNSVERIREYTKIDTEPQGGQPVPAAWPTEGRLEIQKLVVSYDSANMILKGINMIIPPRSRVGIVGRTGSGKTTLSLALFRFLEAKAGSICIDGVDIAGIKLHDLRSRMAIIPQDPTLFTGTIRSNLDPSDKYSDDELCYALEQVYFSLGADAQDQEQSEQIAEQELMPRAQSSRNSNPHLSTLAHPISRSGHNLSHGQRQLLQLAKAFLSRAKIVLMDEATSSVDMKTDAAIQTSIRDRSPGGCFVDSTLIVIAHRLSTLAGFDLVFVMEDGKVVESGSPAELVGERGKFWSLLRESGGGVELERMMSGIVGAGPSC